jgi:hypothetical protein
MLRLVALFSYVNCCTVTTCMFLEFELRGTPLEYALPLWQPVGVLRFTSETYVHQEGSRLLRSDP